MDRNSFTIKISRDELPTKLLHLIHVGIDGNDTQVAPLRQLSDELTSTDSEGDAIAVTCLGIFQDHPSLRCPGPVRRHGGRLPLMHLGFSLIGAEAEDAA